VESVCLIDRFVPSAHRGQAKQSSSVLMRVYKMAGRGVGLSGELVGSGGRGNWRGYSDVRERQLTEERQK
jgi:hypothetical protein